MTITTKFDIGQPVWYADGVYQIETQDIIHFIKTGFDEFGKIQTQYAFTPHPYAAWFKEIELFSTREELAINLKEIK